MNERFMWIAAHTKMRCNLVMRFRCILPRKGTQNSFSDWENNDSPEPITTAFDLLHRRIPWHILPMPPAPPLLPDLLIEIPLILQKHIPNTVLVLVETVGMEVPFPPCLSHGLPHFERGSVPADARALGIPV